MIRVTENLTQVRASIENEAAVAGRKPREIRLVAVSKRHGVDAIRAAMAADQRDFGENFVDEAVAKIDELGHEQLIWHFIGAIQSNKTRDIASRFDWVHTVEREKIARRLNDQRPESMAPLNVCLQINIDDEPQKAGIAADATAGLAAFVASQPRLRLRGLMCLPRPEDDPQRQRLPFAAMAKLLGELRREHPGLDTLSMGMSDDMAAAIREGATMLRVGTAIFGPRP